MIKPTPRLVRKLIESQFPQYSGLPLKALPSPGTDNAIFRLGPDLSVRLPRVDWAVHGPEREVAILSNMTGLALEVPEPVALGDPSGDFPWSWSILKWVDGEPATTHDFSVDDARKLAGFLLEMRSRPSSMAFQAGEANHHRGVPLSRRAGAFRKAVLALEDEYDIASLVRIWEAATPPNLKYRIVWLHGDLHGGNLLTRNGRLSGVIDWGLAGVGDGACDLAAAWTLFDDEAREAFREAMAPGEAEWFRGAGWALSVALVFLAYYRDKAVPVDGSRRTISRLLEDFR